MAPMHSGRCSARTQREDELEARSGSSSAVAEQVAQLAHAVADGLRMHAERGGHRLDLPRPVQPRPQRLLAALAARRRGRRAAPAARGQLGGERRVGGSRRVGEVVVGDDQTIVAAGLGTAGSRPTAARRGGAAREAGARRGRPAGGRSGPSAAGRRRRAPSRGASPRPGPRDRGRTRTAVPSISAPTRPRRSGARGARRRSSSASPGVALVGARRPAPRASRAAGSSRRRRRPCAPPPRGGRSWASSRTSAGAGAGSRPPPPTAPRRSPRPTPRRARRCRRRSPRRGRRSPSGASPAGHAGLDEAPPREPRADPVGGEQRV